MSPRRREGHPTARELEVLELIGRPNATRASVAAELGLSEYTVDAHLRSLYRRLDVTNAVQAAQAARRVAAIR